MTGQQLNVDNEVCLILCFLCFFIAQSYWSCREVSCLVTWDPMKGPPFSDTLTFSSNWKWPTSFQRDPNPLVKTYRHYRYCYLTMTGAATTTGRGEQCHSRRRRGRTTCASTDPGVVGKAVTVAAHEVAGRPKTTDYPRGTFQWSLGIHDKIE